MLYIPNYIVQIKEIFLLLSINPKKKYKENIIVHQKYFILKSVFLVKLSRENFGKTNTSHQQSRE